MQIKFNEVTWYSKLAAVIFFLGIFPCLTFYIGMRYEEVMNEPEVILETKISKDNIDLEASKILFNSNISTYTPIDRCSRRGCLFEGPQAVEGYGKVKGYYHEYMVNTTLGLEEGPLTKYTCKALIVTSGSASLVNDLLKLVREGNSINSITNDGNLIMNIDLPPEFEKIITQSTLEKQIELGVIRTTPGGKTVEPCFNLVQVISAR